MQCWREEQPIKNYIPSTVPFKIEVEYSFPNENLRESTYQTILKRNTEGYVSYTKKMILIEV